MTLKKLSGCFSVDSETQPAKMLAPVPSCHKDKAVLGIHVTHGFKDTVTGA